MGRKENCFQNIFNEFNKQSLFHGHNNQNITFFLMERYLNSIKKATRYRLSKNFIHSWLGAVFFSLTCEHSIDDKLNILFLSKRESLLWRKWPVINKILEILTKYYAITARIDAVSAESRWRILKYLNKKFFFCWFFSFDSQLNFHDEK